jgi:hypothetical protein
MTAPNILRFACVAAFIVACRSSSASCPQLAGRYVVQGEDGRVYITIEQSGCGAATVQYLTFSGVGVDSAVADSILHEYTVDGAYRPDTSWFGEPAGVTEASWVGDTLRLRSRSRAEGDTSLAWRISLSPMPNGDLCFDHYDRGSRYSLIAARQGPDGEDAAARRSGQMAGPRRSCH